MYKNNCWTWQLTVNLGKSILITIIKPIPNTTTSTHKKCVFYAEASQWNVMRLIKWLEFFLLSHRKEWMEIILYWIKRWNYDILGIQLIFAIIIMYYDIPEFMIYEPLSKRIFSRNVTQLRFHQHLFSYSQQN